MTRRPFITFLTDFGVQDDFVGTCHGVIARDRPRSARASTSPTASPRRTSCRARSCSHNSLPYAPVGVHLAVVDPDVGGNRRAIARRCGRRSRLRRAGQRAAPARRGRARHRGGVRDHEPRVPARRGLAHLPRARHLRPCGCASRERRGRSRSSVRNVDPATLIRVSVPGAGRRDVAALARRFSSIDRFGNVALEHAARAPRRPRACRRRPGRG